MSALAQLRHAYHQLCAGVVPQHRQPQFADGLIAPAIREMERGTNPPFDGRSDTWQAACGKARAERDELGRQLIERDAVLRMALEAMEGADQIDCDMRDSINAIRKLLNEPQSTHTAR